MKKKKKNLVKQLVVKNKIRNLAASRNLIRPKFFMIALGTIAFVFFVLISRIFYLQFVKEINGSNLKEAALRQQTTNRIISAKRGNIYDSTGKILATSAAVDTVTINPSLICVTTSGVLQEEETKALKEKVAKAFSDIFSLNYEEVLGKVTSTNPTETIIKKVEQEKVDQLTAWMRENEIYSGINIDDDVKRYYPYNNLASNLIGFCGTDNQGLWGIESYWDSILTGTPGKVVASEDVAQDLIPDKNSTYISAENGGNLTLSIDVTVQGIAEKYLKQAILENDCRNGGNVLIMKPSTGDILAMATYPDYNLNTPFEPNEALSSTWSTLDSTQKNTALNKMWNNKAVAYRYEPGSTFKIINAAVGLEENFVQTDTLNDFSCNGREIINGVEINCSGYGHGSQTLRQALMNSCNPALMQLARRIGSSHLYKYYNAFGLFDRTNIQTIGEVSSYFWPLEDVGSIELATMSFGQRFTVTPIQLITAISCIANDGVLMKPRIVKQVENIDTGTTLTIEPEKVRTVLSKETCDEIINMLESVVSDGTGRYGKVAGYTIAGKTGTSEPNPSFPEDGYVASYVAIAPSQNPELVILVALYNPNGESHQGGRIAAPVVSQILSEVLPYLGIPSDTDESTTSAISSDTITVPDVRSKTVEEAKNVLTSYGFNCKVSSSDTSLLVSDQVPKPGTELIRGSTICIYSSGNEARISQEVPNLKGKSLSQAISLLKSKNLNIHISGNGVVLTQDPMAGTLVEEGTVINITLHTKIQATN